MISSNQAATKSNSKTRKNHRTSKQEKRQSEKRLRAQVDKEHSPDQQTANKQFAIQIDTQSVVGNNNETNMQEAAHPEHLAAFDR